MAIGPSNLEQLRAALASGQRELRDLRLGEIDGLVQHVAGRELPAAAERAVVAEGEGSEALHVGANRTPLRFIPVNGCRGIRPRMRAPRRPPTRRRAALILTACSPGGTSALEKSMPFSVMALATLGVRSTALAFT